MAAISSSMPAPVTAEPKKTGWTVQSRVLATMGRPAVEVGGERLVVVLGQCLGVARPDRRRQLRVELTQHAVRVGASTVDLVDEDQRGDAQAAQRPHQHAGLRLHALDRRNDQDGAVEDTEDPLHLRDEVGVAGRVDDVDDDTVQLERHNRRLDGDPTPPLQRERVGLGGPGVDAAELVDDAGVVQEPLGQARLAGVNMGENPQVEGAQCGSCPLRGQRWPTGRS
jgi:hypothetical protein